MNFSERRRTKCQTAKRLPSAIRKAASARPQQQLKLLKSNFLSEKYSLEDKIIKYYPQRIATLQNRIKGLTADVETAKAHPKPTDDRFIFNGYSYFRIAPTIKSGVVVQSDGVKVSDMERTVIDGIDFSPSHIGFEELLNCLSMTAALNEEKLITYLDEYADI